MQDVHLLVAAKFKALRKELRYTQAEFAQLLQIPTSTADIERGKTKIPGHAVVLLMKNFGINPLWLFDESSEKYLQPTTEVSPKVITLDTTGTENILLVHQKAQAGYAANIQDQQYYESLPAFSMPLPQFRNATYRGFQIEGDSMEPQLYKNDWVIGRAVSKSQEIINHRVYVVVLKDSVMVKKVEIVSPSQWILSSFNEAYPPFSVNPEEVQEVWLVISKISFGIEDTNSLLFRQLKESMEELKSQIMKLKN